MGSIHGEPLQQEHKGEPSTVSPICGVEGRGLGTVARDGSSRVQSTRSASKPSQGQSHGTSHRQSHQHLFARWEADWDIEPEMYASQITSDQNIYTAEDMDAIQQRMLNMENALSRVIRHIEDQALMTQLSRSPEDQ